MTHFPLGPYSTLSDDLSPSRQDATRLYVVAHGIGESFAAMGPLIQRIEDECRTRGEVAELWVPQLPWHSTFKTAFAFGKSLNTVITEMRQDLDKAWAAGVYDEIVFVGYSMGGVALRAMYLEAIDLRAIPGDQPTERRHWSEPAPSDRLVLLAAINKGSGASRIMGPVKALWFQLFSGLFSSIERVFPHRVNATRRNGLFISRLRMGWIEAAAQVSSLKVVQLLGSQDDVVGPNDSLDLVSGKNFFYLDVPQTGHESILALGAAGLDDDPVCAERWRLVRMALFGEAVELATEEVRPWGLARSDELDGPAAPAQDDETPTDVVFVIHGIRDPGHWTDKIARRIWKLGRHQKLHFERVVESYGYFGMGPFLLPWNRRRKVDWMVERYIEARSKFPHARFHFVGHSHGTYLLAKMLELFPKCHFDNVVFVGSIVRSGYPWKQRQADNQVRRFLNFVATADWVVAFFPRALDLWNIQDLGGAGHLGFTDKYPNEERHEIAYAVGGHSAAREEAMWTAIAEFVLDKPPSGLPAQLSAFSETDTDTHGLLSKTRRSLMDWAVYLFSPLSILLFGLILFLVMGVVPRMLVHHVAPSLAGAVADPEPGGGLRWLIAIFVGATAVFAITQARYARPFGLFRSIAGAAFLTGACWVTWRMFPSLDRFAGTGETLPTALHASVSGALIVVWILIAMWLLRKI